MRRFDKWLTVLTLLACSMESRPVLGDSIYFASVTLYDAGIDLTNEPVFADTGESGQRVVIAKSHGASTATASARSNTIHATAATNFNGPSFRPFDRPLKKARAVADYIETVEFVTWDPLAKYFAFDLIWHGTMNVHAVPAGISMNAGYKVDFKVATQAGTTVSDTYSGEVNARPTQGGPAVTESRQVNRTIPYLLDFKTRHQLATTLSVFAHGSWDHGEAIFPFGFASSDFDNTATITNLRVLNADFNPVEFTYETASGADLVGITPVPEPATTALLGSAVLTLVWGRLPGRRRKPLSPIATVV